MSKTIRIATRKSPLALWQAEEVARQLTHYHPEVRVELVTMTTQGDIILDTPLAKIGGKSIDELPENARVGTCSLRRQTQLKERRPDIQILDLRGNVNTRLAKLDNGDYDAIILASAGLIRLGFEERIAHNISTEQSLPAIGQGAVGIECREDDDEINTLLAPLHHGKTAIRVNAERALNSRLNGGCQVPIGGFAELDGDQVRLRGLIGFPDGSKIFRSEKVGLHEHAYELGIEVAEELLAQGGDKVLKLLGIDY